MPDFDVPQVREAAARAEFRRVYGSVVSWERARGPLQAAYLQGAAAAMSVIVPAVTQQIRALHHDVVAYDDFAMTSGRRECSCGRSDCPTVRLLDELDAAVRADS